VNGDLLYVIRPEQGGKIFGVDKCGKQAKAKVLEWIRPGKKTVEKKNDGKGKKSSGRQKFAIAISQKHRRT